MSVRALQDHIYSKSSHLIMADISNIEHAVVKIKEEPIDTYEYIKSEVIIKEEPVDSNPVENVQEYPNMDASDTNTASSNAVQSPIYNCDNCNKHFTSNLSYSEHKRLCSYKCDICNKQFSGHKQLFQHKEYHELKGNKSLNKKSRKIGSIAKPSKKNSKAPNKNLQTVLNKETDEEMKSMMELLQKKHKLRIEKIQLEIEYLKFKQESRKKLHELKLKLQGFKCLAGSSDSSDEFSDDSTDTSDGSSSDSDLSDFTNFLSILKY